MKKALFLAMVAVLASYSVVFATEKAPVLILETPHGERHVVLESSSFCDSEEGGSILALLAKELHSRGWGIVVYTSRLQNPLSFSIELDMENGWGVYLEGKKPSGGNFRFNVFDKRLDVINLLADEIEERVKSFSMPQVIMEV